MADGTHIEWTDATWNPTTGCTRVSAGCDHCYIERTPPFRMQHRRFDGSGIGATTGVRLHSERLHIPLRWRKPRRVFVNSLSDLFHEQVPDAFIAEVFAVMALAKQHSFQVLTKRHARMRALLSSSSFVEVVTDALLARGFDALPSGDGDHPRPLELTEQWWPLPNVWLGVSVEDQHWADIRIPALLQTPAAVRWISAEPLLGPLSLRDAVVNKLTARPDGDPMHFARLDWVVVGGESGPAARPMHPDWARSLRDECEAADVAFLFKQWGSWTLGADVDRGTRRAIVWPHGPHTLVEPSRRVRSFDVYGAALMRRLSKQTAGRVLDGRTHDAYPLTQVGAR